MIHSDEKIKQINKLWEKNTNSKFLMILEITTFDDIKNINTTHVFGENLALTKHYVNLTVMRFNNGYVTYDGYYHRENGIIKKIPINRIGHFLSSTQTKLN